MTESRFILHPGAAQDILEIWEYIAGDNVATAGRVRDEMLRAIRSLTLFPHQGHRRSDLTSQPLRFWRLRDYLIAYAPGEEPLWVVAGLHGRRDPRVLAAILRSRESVSGE